MSKPTREQFENYCWMHGTEIYVREELNGKWGSYNLEELPEQIAKKWINTWYDENRMPIMVTGGN